MIEGSEPSTLQGGAKAAPTVLQVLPRLESGGVERGTIDMAAAISGAGGRALVASAGGLMTANLRRAKAEHLTLPLAAKSPLVMWRNVGRLERVIRQEGVEIVHARSRAPAWSAEAAARRCGVGFVTTFHGTYNLNGPFKRRYNAVMTRGDLVIAISEHIARHLRETYQTPDDRIRVVHRGVDLDIFDPERVSAERVIDLATKWRLPDGLPVVLLPGRLTRWKGQGLLLEALTRLPKGSFCCLLIGDDQGRTAYRQELERQVEALGLAGSVFLPGNCSDMSAAYKLADVVVSASIEPEAFGRVVGEAQAMGRPVVAPDHGGAPEQLIADETGFLFKPGDAEALAGVLQRALALDEAERTRRGDLAQAHVRANFSKDLMTSKTLAVYQEVLARKRS